MSTTTDLSCDPLLADELAVDEPFVLEKPPLTWILEKTLIDSAEKELFFEEECWWSKSYTQTLLKGIKCTYR